MYRLLNLLTAAVALYPLHVAASVHKTHRSPAVLPRDEPVMPTMINVTQNGLVTRDLPPVSYSYYLTGCIDEINNGPVRVLNHQVDWDATGVFTCVQACFNAGPNTGPFGPHYIFAAVVNGNQCWCDNTMNVQAQSVDIGRCNHVCENEPNEYCGGSREYQMYFLANTGLNSFSVNPTAPTDVGEGNGHFTYQGCYPDNPSNRILKGLSYAGPEVTPAYCSALCYVYGYTYSGVEYGDECYCDNAFYGAGTAVAAQNCNQVCEADSTLTCGAPGYINVYSR